MAFTVSLDEATGALTLTLSRAIEHDPPGGTPEQTTNMVAGLINVVATITDSEGATTGYSDTATLSISDALIFEDDEPSITRSVNNAAALVTDDDDVDTLAQATGDFSVLFEEVFGGDEGAANDVTYSLSFGTTSGVVDCGTEDPVLLKSDGTGGVVGYVLINGMDTPVFTLEIDADTGEVTLTQLRAIEHIVSGVATDDPVPLASGACR